MLPFRVGHGYDVHRFSPKVERRLVLGGVTIPEGPGLEGHSDADVLTHALADAVFGALGLPDIGHFFPNNDPTLAGMDSRLILQKAVEEAEKAGYVVGNVDATLVAEMPKIGPHLAAIKASLASILGIAVTEVGLKATTHEKLGALGRAEGMAAHAVVLLVQG